MNKKITKDYEKHWSEMGLTTGARDPKQLAKSFDIAANLIINKDINIENGKLEYQNYIFPVLRKIMEEYDFGNTTNEIYKSTIDIMEQFKDCNIFTLEKGNPNEARLIDNFCKREYSPSKFVTKIKIEENKNYLKRLIGEAIKEGKIEENNKK